MRRTIFRIGLVLSCLLALFLPLGEEVLSQGGANEDMREIVRILFQRELKPDPARRDTEVLVSPRFNSNLLPTLSGFKFKKLDYRDERTGVVYYELIEPEKRDGGIRTGLRKGNVCTQFGEIYLFRKNHGRWIDKAVGAVESQGSGSCPECEIGSRESYSGRRRSTTSATQRANANEPVLEGKVLSVDCRRRDETYIECRAHLSLALTNTGSVPLIVLQPFEEYDFWHGATALALSEAESSQFRYVYSDAAWPSIYKFPIYQKLAELLDQKTPPSTLTRTIQPNGNWIFETTVRWRVQSENNCDGEVGVEIGWNGIEKLSSPLWMRVSFEMWPFNVENFKRNLGKKLHARWRAYGDLYLEQSAKSDWHSSWILRSEPIMLDLRNIEPGKAP